MHIEVKFIGNLMMKKTHPGKLFLGLMMSCLVGLSNIALAYEIEADSTANSVYVLLINENPGAVFHSITVETARPLFLTNVNTTITPATVLGGGSDLLALEFDVFSWVTAGASGDLVLTVSGLAAGNSVSFDITVPLEVVAAAAPTQGLIGVGLPAPDAGGLDTDGDGISDALEVAFGSDPLVTESTPGNLVELPVTVRIPFVPFFGLFVLAAVLGSVGVSRARQRQISQISKGQ